MKNKDISENKNTYQQIQDSILNTRREKDIKGNTIKIQIQKYMPTMPFPIVFLK